MKLHGKPLWALQLLQGIATTALLEGLPMRVGPDDCSDIDQSRPKRMLQRAFIIK